MVYSINNRFILFIGYLELDVHCSDNNNVNVEYLQCPRVHVMIEINFILEDFLLLFIDSNQTRRMFIEKYSCSFKTKFIYSFLYFSIGR